MVHTLQIVLDPLLYLEEVSRFSHFYMLLGQSSHFFHYKRQYLLLGVETLSRGVLPTLFSIKVCQAVLSGAVSSLDFKSCHFRGRHARLSNKGEILHDNLFSLLLI